MKADCESLFRSGNDFELVDCLFCSAADKKEREGAASLNEVQRTLLLAWHAHGVIGNGSLKSFFEADLPVEPTAAALEQIGMARAAKLLRLAPDLFPGGKPDSDFQKRLAQMEEIEAKRPSALNELSTAFWEASDGFDSAMAEFVRANEAAFRELVN